MRPAALLIATAGLAAWLSGCPAPEDGDSTATRPGDTAGPSGAGAVGAGSLIEPRQSIECSLALDGVKLGVSVSAVMERYPEDGRLLPTPVWAVEDATGIVMASQPGDDSEHETSYLLGGQLVGFARHIEEDEAVYAVQIDELEATGGAAAADPPDWALTSSFFEGYAENPKEEYVDYVFWADEPSQVVLAAMYNRQLGAADYMLLQLELFEECIEATAAAVREKQPDPPPPPELPEPPAEPGQAGDYRVDGVKLGTSYTSFIQRYPEDGPLLVTPTWAEEGQTGMLGINPRDGTPLPAEAAVFLYGRLVGLTVSDAMDEAAFVVVGEELEGEHGPAVANPPQWCLETSFFADGYPPTPEYIAAMFWADEESRTLLMAVYNSEQETSTLMVADLDRYQPAYALAMNAAMQEMMGGISGEGSPTVQVPY